MRAGKVEQAKAELKDYLEEELIIQDLSLQGFRCSDGLNNIFNDDDDDFNDNGGNGFYSLYIQVAEDKVLAVTCLHLDHKLEPR